MFYAHLGVACLVFPQYGVRVSFFQCALKGQVHSSAHVHYFFSNLLLILSVNNPTHMYLSDLRVYFKVER